MQWYSAVLSSCTPQDLVNYIPGDVSIPLIGRPPRLHDWGGPCLYEKRSHRRNLQFQKPGAAGAGIPQLFAAEEGFPRRVSGWRNVSLSSFGSTLLDRRLWLSSFTQQPRTGKGFDNFMLWNGSKYLGKGFLIILPRLKPIPRDEFEQPPTGWQV